MSTFIDTQRIGGRAVKQVYLAWAGIFIASGNDNSSSIGFGTLITFPIVQTSIRAVNNINGASGTSVPEIDAAVIISISTINSDQTLNFITGF